MLKFNSLAVPDRRVIFSYGVAVLSVLAAAVSLSLMEVNLQAAAHVSLFLVAIIISTWLGGIKPGLLAITLSTLAFSFFLSSPARLFGVEPNHIPRLVFFTVVATFVGWVVAAERGAVESLRRAHNELRRNNEALRASEARLQVAVDAARIGLFDWDLVSEELSWLGQHDKLFGLGAGKLPGSYSSFQELVHPDDVEELNRAVQSAVDDQTEFSHDYRVIWPDGSIHWMAGRGRFVFNETGQPIRMYGAVREITERKMAEDRIRTIIDTIPVMAWCVRPDGVVDFLNQRWLEYAGPTLEQYVADPAGPIHPDDTARVFERWRAQMALGEGYDDEMRLRRADGEYRWFLVRTAPLRDESGKVIKWYGVSTDIDDRMRAEEALQRTESELRLIIDTIPANVWRATPEGAIDYTNGRLLDELGLSSEELLGWNWTAILHPEDVTRFTDAWREALATGQPMEDEVRVRRANGEYCWYLIRNVPLKNEKGTILRWYGTGVDITERRHAEEALKESQQLIHLVLATLPVGVAVVDPTGDIVLVNEASKRMWGGVIVSGKERWARTKGIWHDSGERIAPADWASVRAVSEGQTSLDELIDIETYDGRQKILRNSAAPIRDAKGLIVGAVIVNEDVTEQVRAEQELRESERKLSEAERLSHLAYWDDDFVTDRLSWSDEGSRILGLPAHELSRTWESYIELIHPDDRAFVESARDTAKQRKSEDQIAYRVVRPGGEVRYIEKTIDVIRDEIGRPLRAVGAVQDVTERKRFEEELKATSVQLRALSARLQSAREEEGTRIAREIHDELGSALTKLRWDLESLGKSLANSNDATQLQKLREKVDSLLALTGSVMHTIRRIASDLRPQILDDLGIAAAVKWQAAEFQTRTGIDCVCDCAPDELILDKTQSTAVFRILQEALTNVARHAQATKVVISMKQDQGVFSLTVTDNGRGITESQKSAHESLGLLGMKERAELIGGTIEISGVEGGGTTITVKIVHSG